MFGLGKALGNILGGVLGVVDKSVSDKDLREKLRFEIQAMAMQSWQKELESAKQTIVAEARGDSWLQRTWRPLVMLIFTGLIVAKWLGFTAPGVSAEIESQLLDIIKIGLGGYIIGRSAEKGVKTWKGKDNGT